MWPEKVVLSSYIAPDFLLFRPKFDYHFRKQFLSSKNDIKHGKTRVICLFKSEFRVFRAKSLRKRSNIITLFCGSLQLWSLQFLLHSLSLLARSQQVRDAFIRRLCVFYVSFGVLCCFSCVYCPVFVCESPPKTAQCGPIWHISGPCDPVNIKSNFVASMKLATLIFVSILCSVWGAGMITFWYICHRHLCVIDICVQLMSKCRTLGPGTTSRRL